MTPAQIIDDLLAYSEQRGVSFASIVSHLNISKSTFMHWRHKSPHAAPTQKITEWCSLLGIKGLAPYKPHPQSPAYGVPFIDFLIDRHRKDWSEIRLRDLHDWACAERMQGIIINTEPEEEK